MVSENPHVERREQIGRARDAFLKAAAALVDPTNLDEALAFALVEGATGLVSVAKADPHNRALRLVQNQLRQISG